MLSFITVLTFLIMWKCFANESVIFLMFSVFLVFAFFIEVGGIIYIGYKVTEGRRYKLEKKKLEKENIKIKSEIGDIVKECLDCKPEVHEDLMKNFELAFIKHPILSDNIEIKLKRRMYEENLRDIKDAERGYLDYSSYRWLLYFDLGK